MYDASDKYWGWILNKRVLQRAAHLVASESRADFHESLLERQIFSHSRDRVIAEIIDSLSSGRYLPAPAIPIAVPKSQYSQRPGSILPYRDRIVIQAIAMIIAPIADTYLTKAVWSWRVKAELIGKTPDQIKSGLFKESDIGDFPFLKRKTISRYIDEIEPWYALWPEFERQTRTVLGQDEYGFMVFSDIAGYFENIQHALLRDLLFQILPEAPRTINLLMRHMHAWSRPSFDGASIGRGIPQGNGVSSFLGNIFLMPIDNLFHDYFQCDDVKYFRYMDDIRIVTKTAQDAKKAALLLEDRIRLMHLNLQSSKTKILPAAQALKQITDQRLDDLDDLSACLKRGAITQKRAKMRLAEIYHAPGTNASPQPISKTGRPLEGLNLRVLKRWSSLHFEIDSSFPITRLRKEAFCNPSFKVGRDLMRAARRFPNTPNLGQNISEYIDSEHSMFPFQVAELFRTLRYLYRVPDRAFGIAEEFTQDVEADPYLRLQAIFLLCRYPGRLENSDPLVQTCLASADTRIVQAGVLLASTTGPRQIVKSIRFAFEHASYDVGRLVQYVRALRTEAQPRKRLLDHVFGQEYKGYDALFDYGSFIRFIAWGDRDAATELLDRCTTMMRRPLPTGVRNFLSHIAENCTARIAHLDGAINPGDQ